MSIEKAKEILEFIEFNEIDLIDLVFVNPFLKTIREFEKISFVKNFFNDQILLNDHYFEIKEGLGVFLKPNLEKFFVNSFSQAKPRLQVICDVYQDTNYDDGDDQERSSLFFDQRMMLKNTYKKFNEKLIEANINAPTFNGVLEFFLFSPDEISEVIDKDGSVLRYEFNNKIKFQKDDVLISDLCAEIIEYTEKIESNFFCKPKSFFISAHDENQKEKYFYKVQMNFDFNDLCDFSDSLLIIKQIIQNVAENFGKTALFVFEKESGGICSAFLKLKMKFNESESLSSETSKLCKPNLYLPKEKIVFINEMKIFDLCFRSIELEDQNTDQMHFKISFFNSLNNFHLIFQIIFSALINEDDKNL